MINIQILINGSLIPYGTKLESGTGVKSIPSWQRNMYELPDYHKSVLIGLLLSDASLIRGTKSLNARLEFGQSLAKFAYVWEVFNIFFSLLWKLSQHAI
jgi:hypothetical protein